MNTEQENDLTQHRVTAYLSKEEKNILRILAAQQPESTALAVMANRLITTHPLFRGVNAQYEKEIKRYGKTKKKV